MAEKTKEDGELETRVRLFDKEFQAIQNKYRLRLIAQVVFPAPAGQPSAVLSVPLIVVPFQEIGPEAPRATRETSISEAGELEDPTR